MAVRHDGATLRPTHSVWHSAYVQASDPKAHLSQYLQRARDALLWKLDGLSEYDIRRPLTPTGTNLLGLVKHVASVEAGYLGGTFGRPFGEPFPWFADEAEPNADMWATAEESREQIVDLYQRVWAHSDKTVAALPLDVVAAGDEYIIRAAVPGLKAEDLHLEVLGDTITIRGEVAAEEQSEEANWLLRERSNGKFARTLTLPTEVDGAKAEAAIENGVLTLRLPKAETARPKNITVKAK